MKVLNGTFTLMGQQFMAMDMPPGEPPAFTWSTSLLVNCRDEGEFDALFQRLSAGGTVMMGPEAIPQFGLRQVAWVTDKHGVTWQLLWSWASRLAGASCHRGTMGSQNSTASRRWAGYTSSSGA